MGEVEQGVAWMREFAGPFARVLLPIAILVVGWLVALIASAAVRGLLRRTEVDNRLVGILAGREKPATVPAEKWISRGVFYVLMLFVLVAFFEATGLELVTEPLNDVLLQVTAYAPRLLSAGLLMLSAWALAGLARFILVRVLTAARVDERLGEGDPSRGSIPENVGNAVYWLIFLIFLPAVLSSLGLSALIEPIQGMSADAIGFLPNVFAGLLILVLGWFASRIVQRILANLLSAAGVDRSVERTGVDSVLGQQRLSALIGRLAQAVVMIAAVISALDALEFRAISAPATHMLTLVMGAIPSFVLAVIIMAVAYFVGRFVRHLVTDLLGRAGFNVILARLGIADAPSEGEWTPSQVAGHLVFLGVILFAAIESADAVGFGEVADMLAQFTTFAGKIVMGLLILGIGIFLANLSAQVVRARGAAHGSALSVLVRSAILMLTGAMALREMGLADDIINLAFGLLLGAVAVAAAIAFGLGARDAARHEVEAWLRRQRSQRAGARPPDPGRAGATDDGPARGSERRDDVQAGPS